ncbi:TRI47 protein, partial [Atractosteus spatula]|nr:TRI47 protein [Atractosteus spatula]
MATAGIFLDQDQFNCSVCLDLLKDPVALPCGHSYCMGCIKAHWDLDDHTGVYRCPQCRETFTPRPVLRRNTMLAELMEKLKQTGLSAPPPAHSPAGPGDVLCAVCTGSQARAVKSCLMCLASYCQTHLQPHHEVARLKRHTLVDANGHLEELVCLNHDKPLEFYCRTDQKCVCYLCTMDEHRGHDSVSPAAGRTEKQKQLLTQTQQSFQERERELQELNHAVESLRDNTLLLSRNTQGSLMTTESQDLDLESHLKDGAHYSIVNVCHSPLGFDWKLLSLRNFYLCLPKMENISMTDKSKINTPIQMKEPAGLILQQICPDEKFLSVSPQLQNPGAEQSFYTVSLLSLRSPSDRTHRCTLRKTNTHYITHTLILFHMENSSQLTLDPNTVNTHLYLSGGSRKVTWSDKCQKYPDHTERFDSWRQVVCREGLFGTRCYWEVEWRGTGAFIGVTYKGIDRKGGFDCVLGHNDQSWSLCCSGCSCSFWHNNVRTAVTDPPSSGIGVYVNHRAGTLSFYSVSGDTVTFLHRAQTSFSEPLYPGFVVTSNVTLCELE